MNNRESAVENVEVTLTPFQGRQLYSFLAQLIVDIEEPSVADVLERTWSTVGDANAVAVWLGENASLELPSVDVSQVLEALEVRLKEDSTPPEDRDDLQILCDNLFESLSRNFALPSFR